VQNNHSVMSQYSSRLFRSRYTLLTGLASLVLLALGCDVLAGWLWHVESAMPENIHMVISTAVCLVLYGAALGQALWRPGGQVHRLFAMVVIGIACLALLEHATGQSTGIDFPDLHAWRHDMLPQPGRMAALTATALLALGAGMLWLPAATPARMRVVQICAAIPLLCGLLGGIAYLVDLELLYSWGAAVRMALSTAVGLLAASAGLYGLAARDQSRRLRSQDMANSVFATACILLIVIAGATGLLIYRLASHAHEQSLQTVMSYSARQRAALLSAQFDISNDTARQLYQHPAMQSLLEAASHGQLKQADAAAALGMQNNRSFNGITIQDGAGRTLVQVGYFVNKPLQAVALRSPPGAILLWDGSYSYRTTHVYRTSAGSARLLLEQRLDMFNRIVQDTAPHDGLSGIYSLCGRDERYLHCFSQSPQDKGSTIPLVGNIHHFTVWPAFSGQRGTMHTIDFSHRNVIGAYEPVSDTGLAFSYKIEVGKLLAPIRRDLEVGLFVMSVVIALGALLLRWRTYPLLREVQQSNLMAELAAERFRNAAEANMDAFAIMEALRGADGQVEDFRVVYINAEAERMWQISRREAIGSQFRQLGIALQIPDFFDSCRRVVENGQAISEETPMAFNIDHPSWMHHEIVKAGDGVSISMRDITQRKLAELDLALREALLKTVTDSIPALVAFIDREERYRYCNKSYMRLFGIRPEQIIGMHMRDFLGDEAYQQLRPEIEKALSGQPSSFERDMSVRGENRYVEGRYIPQQHADGSVSGFYVMIWDITQSRARELELRNKVTLDGMTGLLNRSAFMEMLDDEIKHHYVKRLAVALLFLDIDHFKQVNDTLGHTAGDELIQEFARRLRSQVRATDHVARLGGDEFVILLAGLESERTAVGVAEKLLEAVSHDVELAGQRRKLSTSIGVAYAAVPDITPERLLQIADEALYQAKAAGRNTYRLHRVG
jgi:diguanylate cyclase (GGDEF)-like protein/PAS domain S-box-containing protein